MGRKLRNAVHLTREGSATQVVYPAGTSEADIGEDAKRITNPSAWTGSRINDDRTLVLGAVLRQAGVPEPQIEQFLDSCTDDDAVDEQIARVGDPEERDVWLQEVAGTDFSTTAPQTADEPSVAQWESWKVDELKTAASNAGIDGTSNMKRADLIDALNNAGVTP